MTNKITVTKEFNRIYSSLMELCRRVYADDKQYPRRQCAQWFAERLHVLMQNDELKERLKDNVINHIVEMAENIYRTKFLDKAVKKTLIQDVQELRSIKEQMNNETAINQ